MLIRNSHAATPKKEKKESAISTISVSLTPCPMCNTNNSVYVVPSVNDPSRYQCICNLCGLGESFPDSETEKEAEKHWNDNLTQLKQAYEIYKLQWMIDHGYTLADLVEHLDVMVHEDAAVETGSRTNLQTLFENWEFGVGFTGGSIWPCFAEWVQNDRK